jgi:hypothetical protein
MLPQAEIMDQIIHKGKSFCKAATRNGAAFVLENTGCEE